MAIVFISLIFNESVDLEKSIGLYEKKVKVSFQRRVSINIELPLFLCTSD